jgi:hypothetical protein
MTVTVSRPSGDRRFTIKLSETTMCNQGAAADSARLHGEQDRERSSCLIRTRLRADRTGWVWRLPKLMN